MNITMMYASDPNGLIGDGLDLPWNKIQGDMAHFKKYTTGKIIVMGRTTADSLKKALPNRLNYVLSRTKKGIENGFTYISSYDELLDMIPKNRKGEEIVVIGGAKVYRHFESIANKVLWTEVKSEYNGDTYYSLSNYDYWDFHKLNENDDCIFWEMFKRR